MGGYQPPYRRVRRRPGGPHQVLRRDRRRRARGGVAGLPVLFRYSQWKQQDYTARLAETPEELEAILTPLAAAGVDAFHASTRRYWLPEFDGSDLNLAGWTKKFTGKPVMSVGLVGLDGDFINAFQGEGSPVKGTDNLLDRLEADEFDLVAIGRACSRTRVGGQGARRPVRRAEAVRRGGREDPELTGVSAGAAGRYRLPIGSMSTRTGVPHTRSTS
ncbi:hypothetical protein SCANM63S_04410 [Streptomyces canarius]